MLYDVIVIGGGPGGYTAALYAARANLSVAILEKLSPGGQMGTTDVIDNYPGFPQGVNGFELAMQMKEGAERFGAQTQLAEVTQVELAGQVKTVHTSGGDYQARTVVLATGAHPRELGLPGERELRGRGVSYCATCDGMFYRGKTVVVVGGGNTAVSDVLYLSRLCEKVYLVHRRDTLRASKVYLAKGGERGVRLGQRGKAAAAGPGCHRGAGAQQKNRRRAGHPLRRRLCGGGLPAQYGAVPWPGGAG